MKKGDADAVPGCYLQRPCLAMTAGRTGCQRDARRPVAAAGARPGGASYSCALLNLERSRQRTRRAKNEAGVEPGRIDRTAMPMGYQGDDVRYMRPLSCLRTQDFCDVRGRCVPVSAQSWPLTTELQSLTDCTFGRRSCRAGTGVAPHEICAYAPQPNIRSRTVLLSSGRKKNLRSEYAVFGARGGREYWTTTIMRRRTI